MSKPSGEPAGYVDVDAGCIWVGDPCYIIGEDASSAQESWNLFVGKMNFDKKVDTPLNKEAGHNVGVLISSGYGDGIYPVYVEYGEEGRPARVIIDFGVADD